MPGTPNKPCPVVIMTAAEQQQAARLNATSPETGNTALHVASANNYTAVMKVLLDAGADLNIKNKAGNTVLTEVVNAFLSDSCIQTSSHFAAFRQLVSAAAIGENGDKLMEKLLSSNVHLTLSNCPHRFGSNCRPEREKYCLAMVKSLLQAGVDPGGKASDGTPLLVMALEKKFQEAALLLAKAMTGELK